MNNWNFPDVSSVIFHGGDMPGDKISIGPSHTDRAERIVPYLADWLNKNPSPKKVITVYGGSGVGKSEIGSLLAYYLRETGFPTYLLSGDNYPLRIPEDNDKERLRIFRYGVLSALSWDPSFSNEQMKQLREIWEQNDDFGRHNETWSKFIDSGLSHLRNYLATDYEIDFSLINRIIRLFKLGEDIIPLKRMGREFNSIMMEPVDFSSTKILLVEWTHGNNPKLNGIDYSIFLSSTPEETQAHRRSRARDKGVDSPFVSMVLAVEQDILKTQIDSASLIVSLTGEILSSDDLKEKEYASE